MDRDPNFVDKLVDNNSVQEVMSTGPGAVVKLLLPLLPLETAKGDSRYELLLQMVVAVQEKDLVALIIDCGVYLNARVGHYGTALQCAARFGHSDTVIYLLRSGADVNIVEGEHGTAVRAAVLGGYMEVVDALIEHGADVNTRKLKNDYLILQTGLDLGHYKIVENLIAAGADVHSLSRRHRWNSKFADEGGSALHAACALKQEAVVRKLIEYGADIALETQDEDGQPLMTPLQVAAKGGHLSCVQLLISCGASVEYCNRHGTALSLASSMNKTAVVEYLLGSEASIVIHPSGVNALAAACKTNSRDTIELLLNELQSANVKEAAYGDALRSAAGAGP